MTYVQDLIDHMSDISEEVFAAGWMEGCEWELWDALRQYRTTRTAT